MIKIAFYLANNPLGDTDWSNLRFGNPGVGGSEYTIALTALQLTMNGNVDVTLIVQRKSATFPKELRIEFADTLKNAIYLCSQKEIRYIAFRHHTILFEENTFDSIPCNVGLIVWCHNFISPADLNLYRKIANVKSIVCVGREQSDLYRDHSLYSQIDYIYNGFPIHTKVQIQQSFVPFEERPYRVTYLGSLVPSKGFHLLAKAWPLVLREVPNAELYVIGSGKVYDNTKILGKYGVADSAYEEFFMPYLLDEHGQILPSVHFMGRMGDEKVEVIKHTRVGVPNPTGKTETFGIGAVEFGLWGCRVTTAKCCGYLDTVRDTSGLYSNINSSTLAKYIINALTMQAPDFGTYYNYAKRNFGIEQTSKEWELLLNSLENDSAKIHDLNKNIPNKLFYYKWLRIVNSKLSSFLCYKWPSIWAIEMHPVILKITYKIDAFNRKFNIW